MQRKAAIDRLFVGDRVEGIIDALEREASLGGADSGMGENNRRYDPNEISAQSKRSLWRRCGAGRIGISRRACVPNSA